jgi:hypothetical protein
MSYFMTIAGPKVDLRGLPAVELLPPSGAQEYIKERAVELARLDGSPVFLVHDGSSGTSDGIVSEAWSLAAAGKPFENSILARLISLLRHSDHTVRIWYADNTADAHLRVEECKSMEDMWEQLKSQAGRRTIAFRIRLERTAASEEFQ